MEKPTFIKLISTKYLKNLVKEAKRVKYEVTEDDISVIVRDGDAEREKSLVFKAIQVQRGTWGASFSKLYWQEPSY